MTRYFRCRTNPSGPLLALSMEWEADEMKTHPDYFECDEDGLPIVVEVVEARIPFQGPGLHIR